MCKKKKKNYVLDDIIIFSNKCFKAVNVIVKKWLLHGNIVYIIFVVKNVFLHQMLSFGSLYYFVQRN